jgi:hypothetical protein
MGLRPTHGDESVLLRFIDSKQVTRDFQGSVMAWASFVRRQCPASELRVLVVGSIHFRYSASVAHTPVTWGVEKPLLGPVLVDLIIGIGLGQ